MLEESERETILQGTGLPSVDATAGGEAWRGDLDPSTRYEHRRELGRGGMGEVALAFDRGINRTVAVKRLSGSAPDSIARFVDEARIVGRMEHPNVVPVHDIGVDSDGRVFFVMKYVEGDTLREVIDQLAAGNADYHRRFPFERRLDVFQSLVRALQYAHRTGIIHRDVKPDNIIVGAFGEVMLMDWGIARPLEATATDQGMHTEAVAPRFAEETVEGTCVGTPPYMSPEQAAGHTTDLDARSDLYSAFVVFYEFIALERYVGPKAKSAVEVLVQVQERALPLITDPVFNRPHQPPVPAELRHFLRRGLRKPIEERFSDAEAVFDALQSLRAGDIVVECPVTFAKSMTVGYTRLLDRMPLVGLVIGAIPVVLALAVVALLLWR